VDKHVNREEEHALSRREQIVLASIVGLGLALRLAYFLSIRTHLLFRHLVGDPAAYRDRALAILGGSPVPDHPFFHSSPLYPFFLASVMRVAGPGLDAVRLVQIGVGCVLIVVVFHLTRAAFGKRAAFVASALSAIYVPFIFFEAEFLEITLVMAFLAGMLLLLLRAVESRSRGTAAAAGALLGLASLGKPNLLLFAPVGAVWLLCEGRRPPWPPPGRAVGAAALFFALAIAVISPATIHNFRTSGDFIPVSSNGGINLYIGNHPGAFGVFQVPPDMRFDLRVASKAAAERALGRELTAGEVSDYWARRAFEFMRRRPIEWLGQMLRKFVLFWNQYEIPNHYHLYYVKEFAPILRNPVGTFAVVAPLGLVGLALAWTRRRRAAGLFITFGVTFTISVVAFFITGRYRLPITVVLLPGAGLAVVECLALLGQRRFRAFAGFAVALAILAAAVNVRTIEFGFAQMRNAYGALLGQQGNMEAAAKEFAKALEENPDDLSARYNLGVALLELGLYREAAGAFQGAIERYRNYYEAWLGLGKAYAALGRTDEAIAVWKSLLSLDPPPPAPVAAEATSSISALMNEASQP